MYFIPSIIIFHCTFILNPSLTDSESFRIESSTLQEEVEEAEEEEEVVEEGEEGVVKEDEEVDVEKEEEEEV